MKRTRVLAMLMLFVLLFIKVSISTAQGEPDPAVLPPQAQVKGMTLGDWFAQEWQAIFAIPAAQNPLIGNPWPTCYLELIGNVGLGVTFGFSGSSDCEMPGGIMLFIPIVSAECSTAELPPFYGGNEEELRACVLQFAPANVEASIDGILVHNLEDYTALSPLYSFDLPADNILGAPAGSYDSVAYGVAFLLAPLSPGEHTVHVHGEIPSGGFIYDWVYHITVTN